ncbi:type II secretion system inner membrane protein GspF [Kordiimonas marina]|uniref:type II secretion system inner membrane protein GspF n=1 Tax=Kordiimonas marina TaxID=2872312 RepID=UPI001FF3A06F|nr:type II secretion system inner membrane protein GspF [Kordiimonas marina]MCJ9430047.1 type II secretion system inner membrane protein GspF [Kordiimonas marina]
MQTFEYEALDQSGNLKKGYISNDHEVAARRQLAQKGYIPVRLVEAAAAGKVRPTAGASHRDITLLTRQLATMIGASAPVEDALAAIGQQTEKPSLKRVILAARAHVAEGHKLSDALASSSRAFGPLYLAIVAAGEQSGALAPTLNRLADYQERSHQIRAKIQMALIYPTCLAVAAIAVVALLMTFVVPKVVDQFASFKQQLPLLTRIVIVVSHAFQAYGLYMVLAVVLAVFGFSRALKIERFRSLVDRSLLRLPGLSSVIRGRNAARLARTLATLLASGVPVLEGLRAARKTVTNTVLRAAVDDMSMKVQEGASLSTALKGTGALPPMVIYMAVAGENTGELDTMLDKAADYLESEFETLIALALSVMEPAIIILMGGIVASIVLSIMLPILQLNSLVGT